MRDEDNEKPVSAGRRRLLGTLAAGGAAAVLLPEKWTRPVIDRILVPAHAQQASVFDFTGIYTNDGGPLTGHSDQPGGLFERLVDTIIPAAHASGNLVSCADICIAVQAYPNGTAKYWIAGSQSNLVSYNRTTGDIEDALVAGCSRAFSVSDARFHVNTGIVCKGIVSSYNLACSSGQFEAPRVATAIPTFCNGCAPV